ncbi:MAG: DMT family transporter, partial [Bacillota bacterium]|nr:DMT family transporter [Bacillota bacterium]
KLSFYQFAVCAFLSLAAAAVFENITLSAVTAAAVPVLYGGICSVGVAYTLQAVGQKYAQPAHASILLSMESVFAAIGDFLILHQTLNIREISGCALMLAGMLLTQLPVFKEKT